jgi:hypothetical protein
MTSSATELRREVAANINPTKSRLIFELRRLQDAPGCTTAARELASIIERLDRWQSKHT